MAGAGNAKEHLIKWNGKHGVLISADSGYDPKLGIMICRLCLVAAQW
jgi:hypothetical protein